MRLAPPEQVAAAAGASSSLTVKLEVQEEGCKQEVDDKDRIREMIMRGGTSPTQQRKQLV
jgi:predicted Co/Zn/Cd cation transporter (cation efflux family)